MAEIIDLSLLTQEPIVLKFEEDTFTIPSEPSVELVMKIVDFEDKAVKAKSNKEQMGLFIDMVTLILSQDETRTVNKEFVSKLHLSQLKRIVSIFQQKVTENANNPN